MDLVAVDNMGHLIPLDYVITMCSIGIILMLVIMSWKENKLLALAIIISLVGARLSSSFYTPTFHVIAMLISMYLVLKYTRGLSLVIGLLYTPRVLVSIASILQAKETMNFYFLLSEFFLWIQIILWVGVIINGGGYRCFNNHSRAGNTVNYNRTLPNRSSLPMDKYKK